MIRTKRRQQTPAHTCANPQRRSLMLGLSGAAALVASTKSWSAEASGWVAKPTVDAPGWPSKHFNEPYPSVLNALDASQAQPSPLVQITAPAMAQDGAIVPFTVRTHLPNVDKISVVVPTNPIPLAAEFHFAEGTEPYVVNRLRMKGPDDIVALVHTRDGKTFRASTHVKVTVGGCG